MSAERNQIHIAMRDEAFGSPREALAFFHILLAIYEEQKASERRDARILRQQRQGLVFAVILFSGWAVLTMLDVAVALHWWGL